MPKEILMVIGWDEINGESTPYGEDEIGEAMDKMGLPITGLPQDCTDEQLVKLCRVLNDDEEVDDGDDEPEYGWTVDKVTRGKSADMIEWRSDRNHHAITTIIWG